MKTIPFSPPRVDESTVEAVARVLRSGWITTGPRTREFEQRISAYCGSSATLCLNSWTAAAELALRWFGIGPGDEVIVPVYTYAASANIILHTGATPVFVDCAGGSFLASVEAIASKISARTRAIIPVDVGGLPVDYAAVNALAAEAGGVFRPNGRIQEMLGRPLVLSDAAHSFGARWKGRPAGSQADICGFSFHAVKNLTTAEGGALTLNLPEPFDAAEVWKELNVLGLHGQTKDAMAKSAAGQWQYDIVAAGYKCNMTDIQAAIGLVEMERYERETLPARKQICEWYDEALASDDWAMRPVFRQGEGESSYHLYMLRVDGFSEEERNRVIAEAAEQGVSLNVHFQPLPRLTFYRGMGLREADFPEAMAMFANEISLPVFYGLAQEDADRVVSVIRASVQRIRS